MFSQIADGEPSWVGGILRRNGPSVDLEHVRSVWYRRPQTFRLDAALAGEAEEFARAECRHGIGGVLRGLDCPWVNHPDHLTGEQYKTFQLAVAARHGLRIPETLVTNDPEAAAAFCASASDGVIYKVLSAGMVERVPGRGVGSIFTTERLHGADTGAHQLPVQRLAVQPALASTSVHGTPFHTNRCCRDHWNPPAGRG